MGSEAMDGVDLIGGRFSGVFGKFLEGIKKQPMEFVRQDSQLSAMRKIADTRYITSLNLALASDRRAHVIKYVLPIRPNDVISYRQDLTAGNYLMVMNDCESREYQVKLSVPTRTPVEFTFVTAIGRDYLYRLDPKPGKAAVARTYDACFKVVVRSK